MSTLKTLHFSINLWKSIHIVQEKCIIILGTLQLIFFLNNMKIKNGWKTKTLFSLIFSMLQTVSLKVLTALIVFSTHEYFLRNCYTYWIIQDESFNLFNQLSKLDLGRWQNPQDLFFRETVHVDQIQSPFVQYLDKNR